MTHQPRQIALELGHVKYQGKPCKNGHPGVRYVRDWTCVDCNHNRKVGQRVIERQRAIDRGETPPPTRERMTQAETLRRIGEQVNRIAQDEAD